MPLRDNKKLLGLLLICASYFMYSLHYATVKWLGTKFGLPQLIFVRSCLTLLITMGIWPSSPREVIFSPYKGPTAGRAVLQVACSYSFFLAANRMGLGQVTTFYSTAPLFGILLSSLILGESVNGLRWVAVVIGLLGTAVAADPRGEMNLPATSLALASALFWALTVIFTRKSGGRESTGAQMITTNAVFALVSVCFMHWQSPDTRLDLALMLALGIETLLAQMFFFEACRHAPASLIGPLEYSSVLWSCLLGFWIFGDIPATNVVLGAALIIAGGIVLAFSSRNSAVQPADPSQA
jgi:drug/metabolite transporter (DMT)-like permease